MCGLFRSLKIFVCENLCIESPCADYGADFRSLTIRPAHVPSHSPLRVNRELLGWTPMHHHIPPIPTLIRLGFFLTFPNGDNHLRAFPGER